MRKVTVVGIGYVGLANAVLLTRDNRVTVMDISRKKVNAVNSHVSPINDKVFKDYFDCEDCRLAATTDIEEAFQNADYVIIAVPTDYDEKSGCLDTSIVSGVAESAIKINRNAVIVIKSTVPVGYTESFKAAYPETPILYAPEFLRERHALDDAMHPYRIIVGADDKDALYADELAGLYRKSRDGLIPVRIMRYSEAEAVKLFSNAYLAMRVSFFNELDTYANEKNLDTAKIIDGICLDKRIGDGYNIPSFGYGGKCLPKDTKQLLADCISNNIPQNLIGAIVESNRTRQMYVQKEGEAMEDMITRREHEEFALRQDEADKRLDKRVSLLENEFQKLNELTVAVGKMAVSMENMFAEQKQQGKRLESLEKEPMETYSRVKQAIITTVAGTVAGSLVTALITLL